MVRVEESKQSSEIEFRLLLVISVSLASRATFSFLTTTSEARLVVTSGITSSGTREALASEVPSTIFKVAIASGA